jgi:lysophospholipase L1-like esterase
MKGKVMLKLVKVIFLLNACLIMSGCGGGSSGSPSGTDNIEEKTSSFPENVVVSSPQKEIVENKDGSGSSSQDEIEADSLVDDFTDTFPEDDFMGQLLDVVLEIDHRELVFYWTPVRSVTHYKLLEHNNSATGFSVIKDYIDPIRSGISLYLGVNREQWEGNEYLIQACKGAVCIDSGVLVFDVNDVFKEERSFSAGAMGDSMTASHSWTSNLQYRWVNILNDKRPISYGPSLDYNVAINGSTSDSLLYYGQHTEISNLVFSGLVDSVFLAIGGNDIVHILSKAINSGVEKNIIEGDKENFERIRFIKQIVSNIEVAVDEVLTASPQFFLLVGIPDVSIIPRLNQQWYGDEDKHLMALSLVREINARLEGLAMQRGIAFLDIEKMLEPVFLGEEILVGSFCFDVRSNPRDVNYSINPECPYTYFVDDVHFGALGQGILANQILASFNEFYQSTIPLFSDAEILSIAAAENDLEIVVDGNVDSFMSAFTQGDINYDGVISLIDIDLLERAIAGELILDDGSFTRADIYIVGEGAGILDEADLQLLEEKMLH